MLETYEFKTFKPIVEIVLQDIMTYSIQKYSSNVIEKCMAISPPDYRKKFILEITQPGTFLKLLNNKFGNFVIQKALLLAEPSEKLLIQTELQQNVKKIQSTKTRKKWLDQLGWGSPEKAPRCSGKKKKRQKGDFFTQFKSGGKQKPQKDFFAQFGGAGKSGKGKGGKGGKKQRG